MDDILGDFMSLEEVDNDMAFIDPSLINVPHTVSTFICSHNLPKGCRTLDPGAHLISCKFVKFVP